ncbi:MAG: hypothetical protein HWE21_08020 [Cytophagia bacterium]|nr:hypothetical protein [Cytophagia bacterium]
MIRKQNFKLNWKYAIGEMVLIFLGISLAIAFQNWNEDRKRELSEIVFLEELLEDLKRDSATVDRYAMLAKWKYEDGKYVEQFLKNELQEADYSLVLNNLFWNGRNVQYRPYIPTYDELISTGNLSTLQNAELRSKLRGLFNRYQKNETFFIEEFQQRKLNYNNHLFKYFSAELMSVIVEAPADDKERRKVLELADLSDYRMEFEAFKNDPESLQQVQICLGVDRENIQNQRYNLDLVSDILSIVRDEIKVKK